MARPLWRTCARLVLVQEGPEGSTTGRHRLGRKTNPYPGSERQRRRGERPPLQGDVDQPAAQCRDHASRFRAGQNPFETVRGGHHRGVTAVSEGRALRVPIISCPPVACIRTTFQIDQGLVELGPPIRFRRDELSESLPNPTPPRATSIDASRLAIATRPGRWPSLRARDSRARIA